MRYGYNENDEVVEEEITFTIKCTMRKRWAPQLVSMLKRMQYLGAIGSSRKTAIYSDGDGDFRPRFEVDQEFPEVEPTSEHRGSTLYDAG
jgi:hypothetical protein